MKRRIAFIDFELSGDELRQVLAGMQRFNDYVHGLGLDEITAEYIGNLLDINKEAGLEGDEYLPLTQQNGTVSYWKTIGYFCCGIHRKNRIGYYDFLVAINRKIVDTPSDVWHTKARNGESYGGHNSFDCGSAETITTFPLNGILDTRNKERYLDYIIRHELGHTLIPLKDLPEDATDCAMKPVRFATDEYLAVKNVEYTPEQVRAIRTNIAKFNLDTMK